MRNLIITYNKNEIKNILIFDERVIHLIDEIVYSEPIHQYKVFAEDKLRYYVAGMTQINVKDITRIELNEPDCENRIFVAHYPY